MILGASQARRMEEFSTTDFTTMINTTDNYSASTIQENVTVVESSTGYPELKRIIIITVYPFLIPLGMFGNILTFIVMRRGSMKEVSTCFYMSILALADTGKKQ